MSVYKRDGVDPVQILNNEEKSIVYHHLDYARLEAEIDKAKRADSWFLLVDNNTTLDPVEVLRTYQEQPKREKWRLFFQKSSRY